MFNSAHFKDKFALDTKYFANYTLKKAIAEVKAALTLGNLRVKAARPQLQTKLDSIKGDRSLWMRLIFN